MVVWVGCSCVGVCGAGDDVLGWYEFLEMLFRKG